MSRDDILIRIFYLYSFLNSTKTFSFHYFRLIIIIVIFIIILLIIQLRSMHWDDNFYSTHFFMFFTLSCSFKVTLLSAIGGGSYFPVTTTKSIFIFNENNLFCAYCGRYFYERERMRSETIVFNYMWKKTHLEDDIISLDGEWEKRILLLTANYRLIQRLYLLHYTWCLLCELFPSTPHH